MTSCAQTLHWLSTRALNGGSPSHALPPRARDDRACEWGRRSKEQTWVLWRGALLWRNWLLTPGLQDGDTLTGVTIRNENETQILEGKIAGDEITFKVIRDRDGRKVTAKYKGKITGDTVKGKVESDWSGDWQTLDWEGTRRE